MNDDHQNEEDMIDSAAELAERLQNGEILQDLVGISEETMRKRYAEASDLFEREEYERAAAMFTHLATLDPRTTQYWRAAAFSHIRMGKYDHAMTVLGVAALLESGNPEHYYYCGLCLVKMGEHAEARDAFELAAVAASEDAVYAAIGTESRNWLAKLEKLDG
jgi:type III secretion system low calcium response chaperone LcrH/SycD